MQLVEVKFNHVAFEGDLELTFLHPFLDAEEFLQGSRDNTRSLFITLDGIGFTGTCLTVSEKTHVEAVDGTLHQHFGVFEDLLLACCVTEAGVESILLLFVSALNTVFLQFNLESVLVDDSDNRKATLYAFLFAHGSYPAEDSDLSLHVFDEIVKSLAHKGLIFEFGTDLIFLVFEILKLFDQDFFTQLAL